MIPEQRTVDNDGVDPAEFAFMSTIKRPTAAILFALTCCALSWNSSKLLGQIAWPPKAQSRDTIREFKDPVQSIESVEEKLFPDGMAHDFGKVQRGTQVY